LSLKAKFWVFFPQIKKFCLKKKKKMEIEESKQKKIEELNYDEDDDDFEEFEVEGTVFGFWLKIRLGK
jgi:hypothetical protein